MIRYIIIYDIYIYIMIRYIIIYDIVLSLLYDDAFVLHISEG